MPIQLRTLGELDLRGPEDGRLRAVLVHPKRTALLVYLAVATPIGLHRRDALLALFWPEHDTEHARAALRQALHTLRSVLGDVLITRGDDVGLDFSAFTSDVRALDDAVRRGAVQEAVDLYGGDFLTGFYVDDAPGFERWVESERDRLRRVHSTMLERLAADASRHDPPRAAELWRQLSVHDPYSPRIALRLMQALEAIGDAPAAIRHADEHSAALRAHLDADPDPTVLALAERLRRHPAAAPLPPAPVDAVSAGAARVEGTTERVMVARSGASRVSRSFVQMAAALAVVLIGAATFGRSLLPRPSRAQPPTVALVPFANGSGDTAQRYIADGFTVGLTTDLAMIGGLRLSARGSVDAALRSSASHREAAGQLGADRLIEGSVDADQSAVRVQVRLLDARSNRVLLRHEYSGPVSGLREIHNAVALDLAAAMGITIPPAVQARLARSLTPSRRAFELYTRGTVALNRWNRRSVDTAIAALEAAVAADSTFAPARAALANAYLEKADLFDPRGEWADKARLSVEMALLLSPDLAEAHLSKGNLLWTSANGFPHAAAYREFRRAADLSPSLSAAHDRLALVYLHVGMVDDALREARDAAALDPLYFWARFRVGMVLVYRGQFQEGAEWLQRLPEDVAPQMRGAFLAEALLQLGRPTEAARVLDHLGSRAVGDPLVRARRAVGFAVAGDGIRAREEIAAATALAPGFAHGHHAEYAIGQAYTALGADSLALNWLERAAKDGLPCYPRYAHDPMLRRLRGNPRYGALLRSLQAESERYAREFAAGRADARE